MHAFSVELGTLPPLQFRGSFQSPLAPTPGLASRAQVLSHAIPARTVPAIRSSSASTAPRSGAQTRNAVLGYLDVMRASGEPTAGCESRGLRPHMATLFGEESPMQGVR